MLPGAFTRRIVAALGGDSGAFAPGRAVMSTRWVSASPIGCRA